MKEGIAKGAHGSHCRAQPTGSGPCPPRGQLGPRPASDGGFWMWPWLPGGTGRLQLPRALGRDPGSTASPDEALPWRCPGVSRMRAQDRGILARSSLLLGQKNPLVRREGNTFTAAKPRGSSGERGLYHRNQGREGQGLHKNRRPGGQQGSPLGIASLSLLPRSSPLLSAEFCFLLVLSPSFI